MTGPALPTEWQHSHFRGTRRPESGCAATGVGS